MTDGEGFDWSDRSAGDEAFQPDAYPADTGEQGEMLSASAEDGEGGEQPGGVIRADFQASLASHAYSDTEIAALLQAGLPDSVASLAGDGPGPGEGDANA